MINRLWRHRGVELGELESTAMFAFGSGEVDLVHIWNLGATMLNETHDLGIETHRLFEIVYSNTELTNC